jgi:hypothetical protein
VVQLSAEFLESAVGTAGLGSVVVLVFATVSDALIFSCFTNPLAARLLEDYYCSSL